MVKKLYAHLQEAWFNPRSKDQLIRSLTATHSMALLAAAKRCAQNHRRSRCKICHGKPGFKHTCEFCPNWYCSVCVEPSKHQCASLSQPEMSTTSKARSLAHSSKWDGKKRKAPPMPKLPPYCSTTRPIHVLQYQATAPMGGSETGQKHECQYCLKRFSPLRAEPLKHLCHRYMARALSPPFDRALSIGSETTTPSPPVAAHAAQWATTRSTLGLHNALVAEHKASHRSAESAGEESKPPSHRQDTATESKKPGTTARPQEWTPSDSEEYDSWGTWGPRTKHHTAPEAQSAAKADKAAQVFLDTDDEGSELELTTTYRVKKKVSMAVSSTIEAGYALDHHRSTSGLSQISPSTALKILGNIHTAIYSNPQQYLDRCIEEVIATHGSTQSSVPPQPRYAKHAYWTAQLITKQLDKWACRPSTRPQRLRTYRQGMFRIEDVMEFWGTYEGLTTTEVIEAIKAHSKDKGVSRFTLSTEAHHTMLTVGKTTPIGQAEHKAHTPKAKSKAFKAKKRY